MRDCVVKVLSMICIVAAMPEAGLLRIGELSRRAGVSPELLRAWERRYGLLRPTRTPGGLRLSFVGGLTARAGDAASSFGRSRSR